MRAAGYEPEDFELDVVEVWPENWPAFRIFERVRTQWRPTFGPPTGLDYLALYPLLDRAATTREEWDELFDDVRAMERAALAVRQSATT